MWWYGGVYQYEKNMSVKTCTRAELSVKCDNNCLVAPADRKWYFFVGTSAAIFFGGLAVIVIFRLIRKICDSNRTRLNPSKKDGNKRINRLPTPDVAKRGIYVWLKEQAAALITAQTFKGRCVVSLILIHWNKTGSEVAKSSLYEKLKLVFCFSGRARLLACWIN